jgi:uncharacterized protein (TIGR03000 family)
MFRKKLLWSVPLLIAGAGLIGAAGPAHGAASGSGYRGSFPSGGDHPDNAVEKSERSTRTARAAPRVLIKVRVPAGTRLWFNGTRVPSKGRVLKFRTPPLKPGKEYAYDVRARWKENGRTVTQSRRVLVVPGRNLVVKFPLPSAKKRRQKTQGEDQ